MKIFIAVFFLALSANSFGEEATAYLITTSASPTNSTELHIINTSDSPQSYSGTLYSGSGTMLGIAKTELHTSNLKANGRLILSPEDLEIIFGVDPWTGPAMLEVFSSGQFELMTKLKSPSGFVTNTNCVRQGEVHNIDGFDQADRTFIRLINTSESPTNTLYATMYDSNGDVIGEPNKALGYLDPKAQVWINNRDLAYAFGFGAWKGVASLVVTGDSDLRLLNLNFANNETFFNFSCYEKTPSSTVVTGESTIESRIVSDFDGWSGNTIFQLANGQVWQQSGYSYNYCYQYRPDAIIYQASGKFKMVVSGCFDDSLDVLEVIRLQ